MYSCPNEAQHPILENCADCGYRRQEDSEYAAQDAAENDRGI